MIFALAMIVNLHAVSPPRADPWFGVDKAKHFLVSAFVQCVSYAALRTVGVHNQGALIGASVVTLTVGVGRETHDHLVGRGFSPRDLTWDVLGGIAASALLEKTRR